jgi:hypothetical protein
LLPARAQRARAIFAVLIRDYKNRAAASAAAQVRTISS